MEFSIPKRNDNRLDFGQGHLKAADETNEVKSFPVHVETLDAIAAEYLVSSAGLLKIDVEGAELGVLKGAQRLLGMGRPVIICEVQDKWCARYGNTASDVFSFVRSYDYKTVRIDGGRREEVAGPDIATHNYVFLPQ